MNLDMEGAAFEMLNSIEKEDIAPVKRLFLESHQPAV